MSDRDDAMARRVERAQEAFHVAGRGGAAIGGKFNTKLHPHDRAGKFAQTFTEHPHLAKHLPVAGSPGRGPGDVPDAGKTAKAPGHHDLPAHAARAAARSKARKPQDARAKPKKPKAAAADVRKHFQTIGKPESHIHGAGETRGGKAGRTVDMNGTKVHVPLNEDFTRKVGKDTFTSPAGTTRTWKNGHAHSAPRGSSRKGAAIPAVPVQSEAWPQVPDMSYREIGPDGKVKNGEDTQSMHSRVGPQGQTIYSEERRALHDKIIASFLRGKKPAEGPKRVLFMAGGPASGKSSVLALPETNAVKPPGAVHIDPDEIKKMLPEFNAAVRAGDIRAAQLVHEESSDLGKRLLAEAMAGGHHIIRDGTGDSGTDKLAKQILQMKQAGYEADALYVNAPTEEVVPRAAVRAHRTGRWVPETEIRKQHRGVSAAFNATIRGLAEDGTLGKLQMYQTVSRGQKPILFASADNARVPAGASAQPGRQAFQVHDPALLDAFIKKAQENPEVRIVREADYSTGTRKKLADKGHAMSDGSFPIATARDLGNAVQSIGRAKNPAKAKAHIIKRAKALKLSHTLPKEWNMQEADMDDAARARAMDRRVEERLIAEAADAMLQEMSAEPFSHSKTSNWVAKAGGLPHYIQHIAHDLMEKRGLDESKAIQMAIGIVQRWARGQGKVKGDTRAKAAAAVAEWERMKAGSKGKAA